MTSLPSEDVASVATKRTIAISTTCRFVCIQWCRSSMFCVRLLYLSWDPAERNLILIRFYKLSFLLRTQWLAFYRVYIRPCNLCYDITAPVDVRIWSWRGTEALIGLRTYKENFHLILKIKFVSQNYYCLVLCLFYKKVESFVVFI